MWENRLCGAFMVKREIARMPPKMHYASNYSQIEIVPFYTKYNGKLYFWGAKSLCRSRNSTMAKCVFVIW